MMPPPPQLALDRAILSELGCYYQPDELPIEWDERFFKEDLPRLAAKSAERLKERVEVDRLPDLAQLLREAATSSAHPLVTQASMESMLDWEDDEHWPMLQALFRSIADQL